MSTENQIAALEEFAGVDFGIDGRSVRVSQEAYSIFLAREAAGREKIAALQQRLTAADELNDTTKAELAWQESDNAELRKRVDVLEGLLLSARQYHGVTLLTDPPQDAWKHHRISERIDAELSAKSR